MNIEELKAKYPLTYAEQLGTWQRESYTDRFNFKNIVEDIRDGWSTLPLSVRLNFSDFELLEFCEDMLERANG